MMAHRANTLENAGYVGGCYTRADWMGTQSMLNLKDIRNSELLVGADDSATPTLAGAKRPIMHQAGNGGNNNGAAKAEGLGSNAIKMIVFAAIIGAALYYQRQ